MKKILGIILLVSMLSLTSCFKTQEITPLQTSSEYFPLEIGNVWTWKNLDTKQVSDTTTIHGKLYYIISQYNSNSYYRVEGNKVYTLIDNQDVLYIDFNAKKGDSWQFGMQTVTVASKNNTVTINNHKIAHCYTYSFDVPGMFDDEYSISFAPGIGYIMQTCGICPNDKVLQNAEVNGITFNFYAN